MNQSLKCRTVVLKIASRCNINCSYCYVYNKGDLSYLKQPKIMSSEVVNALIVKAKNHCEAHNLDYFEFIFHGGEPLLTGIEFFKEFISTARKELLPTIQPRFSVQTNGILLNDEWCDLFAEEVINLGISLDGTKEINDRYRVDHKGNGTYERTISGLKIAQENKTMKAKGRSPGLLTVINTDVSPIDVYNHYREIKINRVGLLFPDNTYDDPPVELSKAPIDLDRKTPFADWLIEIFDIWFYDPNPSKPRISLFHYIISLILGVDLSFDLLGTDSLEILSIETDGSIEAAPTFSICGDGFTKAGMNVLNNEFDQALHTDLAHMYHQSKVKLPRQCQVCPINEVCGGGYAPHRYKKENGFNNPSLYCSDMLKLITHIQNRILQEFEPDTLNKAEISPISFQEAKTIIKKSISNSVKSASELELENFSR